MTDIIVPEPVKNTRFDSSDVPEFYEVAKRTNNHLSSMAKQGVIKYGERGELKGKVRLDLTKTYDYYQKVLNEDPVVAHVLKLTMDEWRESHTHRSSWVSLEQAFGLSSSEVEKLFAGRVGCAAESVALEQREHKAWDDYFGCTRKLDKMTRETTLALGTSHLKPTFTKDMFRQRYRTYMEQYFKSKNISGHIANSIRNGFDKGWDVKSPEAIKVRDSLRREFFQGNYKDFIADDYQNFVTPEMRNTKQVLEAIINNKLKSNADYVTTEKECNNLEKLHDTYRHESSHFRYSSSCKQELEDMKKETQDYTEWVSKEILRNLWRE